MKIPYKVQVFSAKMLLSEYPSIVNGNIERFYKNGELKKIIIYRMYAKALLNEGKVSLKDLAPEFDRIDIYKCYGYICENLEHFFSD